MDAGASRSPLGRKIQKLFGGQDASQDNDVISRLPEDILVRILYFLSTEEAIKTSILSKRWKYLWVSIPNFSFHGYSYWSRTKSHDQVLELGTSFLDSIERALFLRNASCLGNFSLSLTMHVGASRLHSWLSAAIKHKVRKLVLYLPGQGDFVVPSSLFTSKSLSFFFFLDACCTLKVPGFICFSGLKDLHLADVVFQDDLSGKQLFSGCPLLENLSLHDCHWENIKEITFEIPSLKSVIFSDRRCLPDHLLNGKIIISALNLEALDVRSFLTVELFPCNLLSLKSADFDIYRWNGRQERISRIMTLLSGLHNAKCLNLSSETLEPLLFAENVEGLLPTFYNLTEFYGFVVHPIAYDNYASGALVYILQKSRNLEVLVLPRGFRPEELDMVLETVPHCFQTSLKTFILFNVDGDEEDLCLFKHVLENAPFLEGVTINCSPDLSQDLEKQQEICQQLRQLRGGAASCLIEIFLYEDLLT